MIDILKAILFGIVEGITEWLPVSSTGHLILLNRFITLSDNQAFLDMFNVVIQLGAILAVIVLFFRRLNPFSPGKTETEKKNTWNLWFKVVVSVIPSAVLGIVFGGFLTDDPYIVSAALLVYGVAFLFVERWNRRRSFAITAVEDIDYRTALLIGAFQCLSLIPGTSRSGSTILGAILLGVSRTAGAEFSFFMAMPTMVGASALEILGFLKDGGVMTGTEIAILLTGCVVSFLVSLLVIRSLMAFVRRRSFAVFGVYRILLAVVLLLYFTLSGV